jgi:predicted XRE-type DNA-binding protein
MDERQFESVWDALEASPVEASNMKARAQLMMAIRAKVETWSLTQSLSAKRLGITQPRLSDLLHGKLDKFSLDALVQLATKAGLGVELHVMET